MNTLSTFVKNIQPSCNYRQRLFVYNYQPLPVVRYSFIQLSEWVQCGVSGFADSLKWQQVDSNP